MKNIIKVVFIILLQSSYCISQQPYILHNNIEDTIKLSKEFNRPALIIFSADWCKHCHSLKIDFSNKKIVEIDRFVICIIDADFDAEYATKFNIQTLPTSVILRNNKETSRKIGYVHDQYVIWLRQQKTDSEK